MALLVQTKGLTIHPPQLDLSVISCRGQQGQCGVEGNPVHSSVVALKGMERQEEGWTCGRMDARNSQWSWHVVRFLCPFTTTLSAQRMQQLTTTLLLPHFLPYHTSLMLFCSCHIILTTYLTCTTSHTTSHSPITAHYSPHMHPHPSHPQLLDTHPIPQHPLTHTLYVRIHTHTRPQPHSPPEHVWPQHQSAQTAQEHQLLVSVSARKNYSQVQQTSCAVLQQNTKVHTYFG